MNCKKFHPTFVEYTLHLFVYCTQWTIDGDVSFENFSLASTDCVAWGISWEFAKKKELVERLSLSRPHSSPLDIPVAYVANEIPARGGDGKNFQPARETS